MEDAQTNKNFPFLIYLTLYIKKLDIGKLLILFDYLDFWDWVPTVYPRLASNSDFSCLSFWISGIIGMHDHAQPIAS